MRNSADPLRFTRRSFDLREEEEEEDEEEESGEYTVVEFLGPGFPKLGYLGVRLPNQQRWHAEWKLSWNMHTLDTRFCTFWHRFACSVGAY